MKHFYNLIFIFFCLLCITPTLNASDQLVLGAEQTQKYLPLLKGKKVALFSNHTGIVNHQHIVDLLVHEQVNLTAIFSPEHGFRGTEDAGEKVDSSIDLKTGIPIYSLYGKKALAPKVFMLFDVLVVDIQDVGLRFYTYYISMLKLMNKCAQYNKQLIVLDRPNPNGFYVDGPILDVAQHKSGVGALPIPIVHGLTLGEMALMINGEKWLDSNHECELTVIPCLNYTHQTKYKLPIAPSPNLPNMKSVYLYPSTCFFEGTVVSLGRGTASPFQMYGHPDMKGYVFSFTPESRAGAKHPKHENSKCFGIDLRGVDDDEIIERGINLDYIINAYRNLNIKDKFFTSFFDLLAGRSYIREMIEKGYSSNQIKAKWRDDIYKFRQQRKPYLLYKE